MRQHHHVGREPVAADVRDLPRLVGMGAVERLRHRPTLLGAARVVAAVGADAEERAVVRRQAARAAPTQRAEVDVEHLTRVGEAAGLEARADRVGVRREDAEPVAVGRGAEAPDEQDLGAVLGGPPLELGAEPVGQPGVAQGLVAPRADVLEEQPGADVGGGAEDGLVAQQALGRTAEPRSDSRDLQETLAHEAATQHQAALRVERQVGGRELAARADLVERRSDPGRHRSGCGRRAAPRPGRRGRAARRGVRPVAAAGWWRRWPRGRARRGARRPAEAAGWSGTGGSRPRRRRSRRPGVRRAASSSSRSARALASRDGSSR